jgi:hypothetical protein
VTADSERQAAHQPNAAQHTEEVDCTVEITKSNLPQWDENLES